MPELPAGSIARLKAAYNRLEADAQGLVKEKMREEHRNAVLNLRGVGAGEEAHPQPDLALSFEALFPDEAATHGQLLDEKGLPYVAPDGTIYGSDQDQELYIRRILDSIIAGEAMPSKLAAIARLKAAYDNLPPDAQRDVKETMREAHRNALFDRRGVGASEEAVAELEAWLAQRRRVSTCEPGPAE